MTDTLNKALDGLADQERCDRTEGFNEIMRAISAEYDRHIDEGGDAAVLNFIAQLVGNIGLNFGLANLAAGLSAKEARIVRDGMMKAFKIGFQTGFSGGGEKPH